MLTKRFTKLLFVAKNSRAISVKCAPICSSKAFKFCNIKANVEKIQFKSDSKKMLDIVAKSLYKDS